MPDKIRLYTLSGLAEELGHDEADKVGVDYLNKLAIKYKNGERLPHRWQGYRFIQVGSGQRGFWLVSNKDLDIEIIDAPTLRKGNKAEEHPVNEPEISVPVRSIDSESSE